MYSVASAASAAEFTFRNGPSFKGGRREGKKGDCRVQYRLVNLPRMQIHQPGVCGTKNILLLPPFKRYSAIIC